MQESSVPKIAWTSRGEPLPAGRSGKTRRWSRLAFAALLVALCIGSYAFFRADSHQYDNVRGWSLMNEGRYDEAIVLFGRAISAFPTWYQPYMNRGEAYRRKGDLAKALSDFDKAIALKAGVAESHYDRGLVWIAKDDMSHALHDFDETIRIEPKGDHAGPAFYERALLLDRQHTFAAAIDALDHSLALQKTVASFVLRAKIEFFDLDRPTQAADDFVAAARAFISDRASADLTRAAGTDQMDAGSGPTLPRNAVAPNGLYVLLWAHYARAHAGQDDGQEMTGLAKSIALPIWKKLFAEGTGQPSAQGQEQNLLAEAEARALRPWPGIIYLMFLGRAAPQEVRAAASSATGTEREQRQCDVDFYLAIYAMQAKSDGRALLKAAAAGCPAGSMESAFAKAAAARILRVQP